MSTSPYQKLFHNFWIPKSKSKILDWDLPENTVLTGLAHGQFGGKFRIFWTKSKISRRKNWNFKNPKFFNRRREFLEIFEKIEDFLEKFWKIRKREALKIYKIFDFVQFWGWKTPNSVGFSAGAASGGQENLGFWRSQKTTKTTKFLALAKKTTINLWNPKFWLRQKTTKNFQWPVPTKSENLRFWVFCRKFFSRNLALAKIGEFFGEFPKFCRNFGNPKKMFLPWIFCCFVRISKKFSLSPMNLWILAKGHTNFRINSQIRI